MEIDKATGQVLLRALRWHDKRMQEIGNSESQILHNDKARVAFDEARFAADMLNKIERGGMQDIGYVDGQLLMRALQSYRTHIIRTAEGAALASRLPAPFAVYEYEVENAAINLLIAGLEQNGVRIQ